MCKDMCSTMIEGCEKCIITKFEKEYSASGFSCEEIFMVIHLLGYNENTVEYIKQQYKNMKIKICSKNKCCTCPVNEARHGIAPCLEIYIGMDLLKEV